MPETTRGEVRLCAGTLFDLLYSVRNQIQIRNPSDMYEEYIRLIYPEYVSRYGATEISHFKSCDAKNKRPAPFYDENRVQAFREAVRENYDVLLNQAGEFVKLYLNTDDSKDMEWLTHALIQLIIDDDSIADDTVLYIDKDGKDKSYIRQIDNVLLPGLIIGALCYAVTCVPDNSVGEATASQWLKKQGGSREVSRERVNTYTRYVKITLDIPPEAVKAEEGEFHPEETEYFNAALDEYGNTKTFFYSGEKRPLDGFFVCGDICVRRTDFYYNPRLGRYDHRIHDCTIATLKSISLQTILTGDGGLGKSMMTLHLMVDAIRNRNSYRCFPIYITLRYYKKVEGDYFAGIFDLLRLSHKFYGITDSQRTQFGCSRIA